MDGLGERGNADAGARAGESGGAASGEGDPGGNIEWSALNAKFRAGGFVFIANQPLGRVMLLRRCFEPFRALLSAYFRLAGEEWDLEQRAKDVAFLAGAAGVTPREYRVVVAASCSCKLEIAFLGEVWDLQRFSSLWCCPPPSCFTAPFKNLVCRLLSRMGCTVEQLLMSVNSQSPRKLFLLIEDSSLAELFATASECQMDAFTKAFVGSFKESGPSSPEALLVLRCIASVWKLDISEIEAKHASIRRLLKAALAPVAKQSPGRSRCHRLPPQGR